MKAALCTVAIYALYLVLIPGLAVGRAAARAKGWRQ